MANHVELATRAERDLRDLRRNHDVLRRVREALERLRDDPPPENLDIRTLTGYPPWRRVRVGEHRIVFRALTDEELRFVGERGRLTGERGYLVGRIVDRRDLEAAARQLGVHPPQIGRQAS